VNVPFGTTTATVVTTASDTSATISSITGTTGLVTGDNTITFSVYPILRYNGSTH